LSDLEGIFTEEEVWAVIKELPQDRAPGPDGFIGLFYQKAWATIKQDVMAALLKLYVGDGKGFNRLNQALITLIPKKPDTIIVRDYRPISLVHSFSKLFSKIIANRLRGKLGDIITANQSAFVKGQCLHDNFILVRQLVRKIHYKKEPGVLIKLDLSRAFDSISWSFLFEIMRALGFGAIFLKWISIVLSSASSRVVVNGMPRASFKHVRGLRQGDPISPMLFNCGMEALTALFVKAANEQLLSPLAGCSAMQRLSIYADDVVVFVRPVVPELVAIRDILTVFGEASGLKVNYSKSSATVIRGGELERVRTQSILGCPLVN
jgi:hypothetical protein